MSFAQGLQLAKTDPVYACVCVQVEGGFMQGVGLYTLEELRYSPQGYLFTRGPGMYKIPAFGDIPTELNVSLLRDAPNEKAIFSSKVRDFYFEGFSGL